MHALLLFIELNIKIDLLNYILNKMGKYMYICVNKYVYKLIMSIVLCQLPCEKKIVFLCFASFYDFVYTIDINFGINDYCRF